MRIRFCRSGALATARGFLTLVVLAGSLPALAGTALGEPAYFRYPDISGDKIVFCAEADLWIVSDQGGPARRLTTHPGSEYFPFFSPDGKSIAFTGEYDGNRDVYVIPVDGGEPRRLTWHPGGDEVVGWTPDGKKVLFRSNRAGHSGEPYLYSIPVGGGDPEMLPIGWATRIDIDPASGMWAFNRKTWENATWKRYRGGTAPDIWVGDPGKGDFRKITTFDGPNAFPMWHAGRIYYLSDQGGTMNIWSIKPDGSDAKRHTDFKDWDARQPNMGPDGRIAFTLGADIWLFNAADNGVHQVPVDLESDRVLTRVRYPDAAGNLSSFDISPDGDRLAVVCRGEIFSVPVKDGVTLPVTRGSGARESYASFDPEGKRLVYVTDASREEEIRTIDAWGRGEPKVVLPAGVSGWHFPPVFSPDGKWIAYADQTQTLYVMPAEGGAPKKVDQSTQSEIRNYVWSPDGRWLAYDKALATDYWVVSIYDTKDGQVHPLTTGTTSDYSPAWDPDGRYLYFLSDRSTNPFIGAPDYDVIEGKNTTPFMALLRKDVKNPLADLEGLPPGPGDEKKDAGSSGPGKMGQGDKGDKGDKGGKGPGGDGAKPGEKKEIKPVAIDFDGLADRIVELPVDRGRYFDLRATADKVFYLSQPLEGMAEGAGGGPDQDRGPENTLMAFDLKKKEDSPFVEGVSGYVLAAGSDKIAVMKKRGDITVMDAGGPGGGGGPGGPGMGEGHGGKKSGKVDMSGIVIELDPRGEWEQMYYEAWRHERDFFWDPGLGGVDWKAVRDHYGALLPRLATRDDFRDLVGEMIGELNNSHTYVWGGDPGVRVTRVPTGLLGADVQREGAAYKVVRIYRGDPADHVESPLLVPGADVHEGDYLLAVNHVPFDPARSFYSYFENRAGKEVVLTVNGRPSMDGSRDAVVKTVGSENDLRYSDWIRNNREYVARKTGGKIGYLHLPDMGNPGMIEFNTWFYPQMDKEGMVVDCRWNRGGSISQILINRFARKLVSFDRARAGGLNPYPQRTLNGPFVVLTNEFAGSDGDIFPAAVQILKLAPVIGMRSWGGVVGIRADKQLVDGGLVTEPEFAWWDLRGWAIENHGVDPDIELQNMPQDLARGQDAQLDRAIEEVLKLHAQKPPIKPQFGPVRQRTRAAFARELSGTK